MICKNAAQQKSVYGDNLNTSACKMTENYFGKDFTFFVIIPFFTV